MYAIAAYRPKKGKERTLPEVLKDHLPILRKERLVTDRPPYLMRAADGREHGVAHLRSKRQRGQKNN